MKDTNHDFTIHSLFQMSAFLSKTLFRQMEISNLLDLSYMAALTTFRKKITEMNDSKNKNKTTANVIFHVNIPRSLSSMSVPWVSDFRCAHVHQSHVIVISEIFFTHYDNLNCMHPRTLFMRHITKGKFQHCSSYFFSSMSAVAMFINLK